MKEITDSGSSPPQSGGAADLLGANSEIGRKLKLLYDNVLSEDVPDRFSKLLSDLEAAESNRPRG